MKIAFHPCYAHLLPAGHRFPMLKYELLPQQLLYYGIASAHDFICPEPLSEYWILQTHQAEYWNRLKNLELTKAEIRRSGFPLDAALVEREIIIAQGTINLALYALQNNSIGLNIAGGTHHAYANRAEGFCLLNDIAIAANFLLHQKLVKQILVIDLDVHQGNGTAKIFEDNPAVFTFSMHGKDNFPLHKERSDLDIALPTGCHTDQYLQKLYETLPELIRYVKPDIVFYQAGVDILETDLLGKLKVSAEGVAERDRFVFDVCRDARLPIVVTMGGGYSADIKIIVNAHCETFRQAANFAN
ncbi:MAG: histone deacetylase [Bacteroidia bacterium]|nr:histone deacetylase [Bacteroidia bacterium]